MESNPTPGSNEKLCNLNQEKFRQNPNAYGWSVKGWIYFTSVSGSNQSYQVKYEATIAPLELTRENQIEQFHIDVPNELVEELLTPVREAVRAQVFADLDKTGLHGGENMMTVM